MRSADKLHSKTTYGQVDNLGYHFGCFGSLEQQRETTQIVDVVVAEFALLPFTYFVAAQKLSFIKVYYFFHLVFVVVVFFFFFFFNYYLLEKCEMGELRTWCVGQIHHKVTVL